MHAVRNRMRIITCRVAAILMPQAKCLFLYFLYFQVHLLDLARDFSLWYIVAGDLFENKSVKQGYKEVIGE
jgi:hypothetical protein